MEFGVPALAVRGGRVVVSSRDVAQVFEKQHFHVLSDVDALIRMAIASHQNFDDLMFQEVSAFDPAANRVTRSFEMNRDGFTLLAMGYTGPKALQFKLAYIRRFNEMEEELRRPQVLALPAPTTGLTLEDVDRRVDARLAQVFGGASTLLGATGLQGIARLTLVRRRSPQEFGGIL